MRKNCVSEDEKRWLEAAALEIKDLGLIAVDIDECSSFAEIKTPFLLSVYYDHSGDTYFLAGSKHYTEKQSELCVSLSLLVNSLGRNLDGTESKIRYNTEDGLDHAEAAEVAAGLGYA